MNSSLKPTLALCALVAAFLGTAPQALAFFPFGGTSSLSLDLRMFRWSIDDMDVNGDGDVSGDNEGISITVERGDFGFTAAEEDLVTESFEVWEDVPTSFVAFQFTSPIVDPAGIFSGGSSMDGLNVIAMQVPGDPINAIAPPILGAAFLIMFLEDGFMTLQDGTMFEVEGARFLEVDLVIEATQHRGPNPAADLRGTVVHEVGHLLGIGHNPMGNMNFNVALGTTVETALYAQPDATGTLQRVGVTPTMFPFLFFTDDGTGILMDGGIDLAPDDIAAVSFLYPRTDQSSFFALRGEARGQSRGQIPSAPVLGSLITAWADVDNNFNTPRVPILSTMTGLYVPSNELSNRGFLLMPGLLKEFFSFGDEAPFQATYTFTMEAVNGINQPFSGAQGPTAFDSTHTAGDGTPWTVAYDALVQTETYFADGELFGSDNRDAGTQLAWDPLRNTIVDPRSGRSFASMVANDTPMFGDKSEVCPLLVIEQEFAVVMGPNLLRGFRDKMLLQTAAGVALVDAYYQAGPALARLLREKPLLLKIAGVAAVSVEWFLVHGSAGPLALVLALVMSALFIRKRRRVATIVASVTVIAVLGFLAAPSAHAAIYPVSESELIGLATGGVIEGTVESVESRLTDGQNGIVTTVGITVNDTMKGSINKQSMIFIDLPYGRVGNFVVKTVEFPTYTVGEEVILFLMEDPDDETLIPLGGIRGKHKVAVNPEDGKRYVVGDFVSQPHMKQVSKTVRETKGLDPDTPNVGPYVELDDYKAFVRGEVRKQRKRR